MKQAEHVILVDENDNPIGEEEKITAHEKALCHRAFSIFIFNNQNEILMQQRHPDKYHCGGLWTNTCCSHPRPGESTEDAAQRRLYEEIGLRTPLKHVGKFHYIAPFENGLTENEVDHVFVGRWQGDIFRVNPDEIANTRWQAIDALKADLDANPSQYTPWLKQALAFL